MRSPNSGSAQPGALDGARIVGFAFCPAAPRLLPGATGGPVSQVERLRQACGRALAVLGAARPDAVALVAVQRADEADSPVSLAVGRSLLAGARTGSYELVIPADLPPADCAAAGEDLLARAGVPPDAVRIAVLVIGDGSARRAVNAPGYLDERAPPFDAAVDAALRNADLAALAGLDPQLAEELMVAGRAAWQVAAGAAGAARQTGGWLPTMLYADDPFGVYYPVAVWQAC
jgi:hypothetical protein